VFLSSLPGGPIVLEGFVGDMLRSKPGSSIEVEERDSTQQMVLLPTQIAWD